MPNYESYEETEWRSHNYEFPIGTVIESVDVYELSRWQDDALCHGMQDLYDLTDKGGSPKDKREVVEQNRYKLRQAKRICFECPVFQDCWDDAWGSKPDDRLPLGVIRAAAKLTNVSQVQREKAMMRAYKEWQEHQEETRYAESE